ncbi:MAG: CBS domain-containing protein [Desulfurococcales archaeon]|nr:CBS domain-containing protein [Desulfurococcales archaeon]
MPEELKCEDIMSTPPVTASPTDSAQLAARKMVDSGVGSLIVVDENGSLLGIVTKTDLVREVVAPGKDPLKVMLQDVMTRNPYYVTTESSVREAADIMGTYGIGHLPVLDPETQRVVGVISMRDIVRLAPHYIEIALLSRRQE